MLSRLYLTLYYVDFLQYVGCHANVTYRNKPFKFAILQRTLTFILLNANSSLTICLISFLKTKQTNKSKSKTKWKPFELTKKIHYYILIYMCHVL